MKITKKGTTSLFELIIFAFVALVLGAVLLLVIKPKIDQSFGVAGTQLGGLDDHDNDHVANFYDVCPCTPIGTTESSDLQGCPGGSTAETSQEDKKNFKAGTCPESAPMAGESESTTALKVFSGTTKISSDQKITSDSIRYEATCATKCMLEVVYPTNTRHELEYFSEGYLGEGELQLTDLGLYFLVLKELQGQSYQEKIQFRIEKLNNDP